MTSPNGPICDFCKTLLPGGAGIANFHFSHERFCSLECSEAAFEKRRQEDRKKQFCIQRYRCTRFWGVFDGNGELIVVTVYKKGANEVLRRLTNA